MFNKVKKTKETVGIDIGSYSIKITSVLKTAGKSILTSYNIKENPLFSDKPVSMAKTIEEAFDEVGIKPGEVNFALSGSNVIVRFFTLPKMTKEQLEGALVFEAEKYIPFNVNEVIMDALILDDAGEGQMNVLLAAAKKDFVQTQMELFEKLGVSVKVIDISAFSIFNAFSNFNKFDSDKGAAFLDLGYSQANILISTGKMPRFTRLIQIGGKDIAAAIAEDMGVTVAEAEAIKVNKAAENKAQIDRSTAMVMDELIKEIQLSFGYFENKYNTAIEEVYCSGGLVYQAGVTDYLKEKLGTELKIWNPVAKMDIAESLAREAIDPVASKLAVSIGLALRG